ncbi:MAG: molecular chaperone DnaJ [Planctomycetota bacterium]
MYLSNHNVTFEPIETWPYDYTASRERSRFDTPWHRTLRLLDFELCKLGAKQVVIQCDLDRSRIRNDGAPRFDARIPPPIILSFDSKHGPQLYPCDTYSDWKDNVRAIALSLEALRKVDRYGVTRRAEQYRGFQSLPAPASDGFASRQSAWQFLSRLLEVTGPIPDKETYTAMLREAERKTHPDAGGDANLFKQVQRAKEWLA